MNTDFSGTYPNYQEPQVRHGTDKLFPGKLEAELLQLLPTLTFEPLTTFDRMGYDVTKDALICHRETEDIILEADAIEVIRHDGTCSIFVLKCTWHQ